MEPGSFQTDIWTRGAVMGEKTTTEASPNFQRSLKMRDPSGSHPKRDPIEVAELIARNRAGSKSEVALPGGQRREVPA